MPLISTLWLFECFKRIVVKSGKEWDFVESSYWKTLEHIELWSNLL
jgi:hypothetical protein